MTKKDVYINEELDKLGKRLKALRLKRGYTNYESFAFENGIPRAQYGRYENGQDLRFSSLLKVLKAFDISLEEFFSNEWLDERANCD